MVKKILFITLSNIGDCILTLPCLDQLIADHPGAGVTVMAGPRASGIFEGNPAISRFIAYDKHAGFKEKKKLFDELRREKFDLVVDLRNSFFGVLLPAKRKGTVFFNAPRKLRHMSQRQLWKIRNPKSEIRNKSKTQNPRLSLQPGKDDEIYIGNLLKESGISDTDRIIVVAAGARSSTKRWPKENFLRLVPMLAKEFNAKIILAGDKDDAAVNKYIAQNSGVKALDLSDKTSIMQLACLLNRSQLLVTNDSATMHLASYLGLPVVAIFGPTDDEKYSPWSKNSIAVRKEIFCRPCRRAQCRFGTLECLHLVRPEDVLRAAKKVLTHNSQLITHSSTKRILIMRTDRIGDVLLSTPVIRALRQTHPDAYIAMMVSTYARQVVEGNPDLDRVIVYDKDAKHKSWMESVKFARDLKKKNFDLAVILHPTNRSHIVAFLADIPRRVGYGRKMGFLLTDALKHTKQLGEKHEVEYALDMVRYLGIEPKDKCLSMHVSAEAQAAVKELLSREGIRESDRLLAIHPGASCPSKVWPAESFAQAADRLADKFGLRVIIVAGPKDLAAAWQAQKFMQKPAVNLAGKTSVPELAALLKKCALFISNDSGPVHISSAVGTPVISIFGRSQKGLGPLRWGPTGKRDRYLHKDVGCLECLAHNCVKGFLCLKAISVDDVVEAAEQMLSS